MSGAAALMAYVGQIIDIPFGRAGLTGTRNLLAVRPDQLIEASNVSYEGGTLQKEPGALRYNAALARAPPALRLRIPPYSDPRHPWPQSEDVVHWWCWRPPQSVPRLRRARP